MEDQGKALFWGRSCLRKFEDVKHRLHMTRVGSRMSLWKEAPVTGVKKSLSNSNGASYSGMDTVSYPLLRKWKAVLDTKM